MKIIPSVVIYKKKILKWIVLKLFRFTLMQKMFSFDQVEERINSHSCIGFYSKYWSGIITIYDTVKLNKFLISNQIYCQIFLLALRICSSKQNNSDKSCIIHSFVWNHYSHTNIKYSVALKKNHVWFQWHVHTFKVI